MKLIAITIRLSCLIISLLFLSSNVYFSITSLNDTKTMNHQNIPTIEEVQNFFNNQNLLITYREGEVLYGTYFFLEIHYCPSGQYKLYGRSVKQTVLGNEQQNNWQEYGTWKVIEYNGLVGLYYTSASGKTDFIPIYKLTNGDLFINQGVSIVKQGVAICS